MIVWLALGVCFAGIAATAPMRIAMAVVVFFLPFSGTVALMMGTDPILLPLVVTMGFLARHAFSLLIAPLRNQFIQIVIANWPLLGFVLYCAVSGMFFPKLFEGATLVTPQVAGPAMPLSAGSVSLPQIIYLFLGAYLCLALRQYILRVGMTPVLIGVLAQVAAVGGLGMVQAALGQVGLTLELGWIVNNTGYALLNATMEGGFARVTSVFPEASTFAVWGAGALAFCYALYVNRILPMISLALTVCIGVTMLISTSSTAYAGILFIGAFALLLALMDGDPRRRDRSLMIVAAGGLIAAMAVVVVFTADNGFSGQLREMIESMTINKSVSASALERNQWTARSIQNGIDTGLLGIGYGAGRGSGLISVLFGLVGVPGLVLFAMMVLPSITRAFRRPHTGEEAVMSASGFALAGTIGAMSVSSPDLQLANVFWSYLAIAGVPLALRMAEHERPEAQADLAVRRPA